MAALFPEAAEALGEQPVVPVEEPVEVFAEQLLQQVNVGKLVVHEHDDLFSRFGRGIGHGRYGAAARAA